MSDILMRVHSKSNDRWFTVRLLQGGDTYGLKRCLTWGVSRFSGEPGSSSEGQPGVEFYDATFADDPKFELGLGQFTGGRYYAHDIMDGSGGLDLMGYVPEWKIDGDAMLMVRLWLTNVTQGVPRPPAPGRSVADARRAIEDVLEGRTRLVARLAPESEGGAG